MRYSIHETNIERLEKKLTTIANKCKKYGCDFHYEVIGEEFKKDENEVVNRYVVIEAEGTAKVNEWTFVATVEFYETGNVIRRYNNEVEIPKRYYDNTSVCEHCNTLRRRNNTYLVMNTATGEFKQVGKSCLKDFTNGLSAELVAQYIAAYDSMIVGQEPDVCGSSRSYIDITEYLGYVAECVKHFGFYGTSSEYSTKERAHNYMVGSPFGKVQTRYEEEMEKVGFNCKSKESISKVEAALEWIRKQEDDSEYIHNLKVICSQDYITANNLGFVASLIHTYNKAMDIEEKRRSEAKEYANSQFVGTVGERINVKVNDVQCVSSIDTQYGTMFVYKMVDVEGNVFVWKTGKGIDKKECTVVGTIKAHNEFRGTKQTELTRCKIN